MAQLTQAGPRPIHVLPDEHPNHHLSRSRGTWYVHHLAFPTPYSVVQVRRSLHTRNLLTARRRRDQLLRGLSFTGGAE